MPTCMYFNGETLICERRGSSVSVEIRQRAGRSEGLRFSAKENVFSAYWDDTPTVDRIPAAKRTVREATHFLTSDAEVKNEWSFVPTPF